MKFSVLIPTRNRLEYLKYAITSVLQQEEMDFEIIVTDNCSEQDIKGYIDSLQDPRIKYFRSEIFLSVTENWNAALNKSSGDWVIMLGDDDCLMRGYFSTISKILNHFENPDFIYTSGYIFAYPHVLPLHPKGLLKIGGNASFLENQKNCYWIDPLTARKLAQGSCNFTNSFAYNMQYALINRAFIEKIKIHDQFFHSPYPDFYAMNAMMLKGARILACPFLMVAVGITPKSYGYYYFNKKESDGICFLKNTKIKEDLPDLSQILLPGPDMNESWLYAMESLKQFFPEEHLTVSYKRYRLLQIFATYKSAFLKEKRASFKALWTKLFFLERLYVIPIHLLYLSSHLFPYFICKKAGQFLIKILHLNRHFSSKDIQPSVPTILDFFTTIEPIVFNNPASRL